MLSFTETSNSHCWLFTDFTNGEMLIWGGWPRDWVIQKFLQTRLKQTVHQSVCSMQGVSHYDTVRTLVGRNRAWGSEVTECINRSKTIGDIYVVSLSGCSFWSIQSFSHYIILVKSPLHLCCAHRTMLHFLSATQLTLSNYLFLSRLMKPTVICLI